MSRYRVYYRAGAESHVDVEAEDRDEAIEKAEQQFQSPGLCAYCSGWGGSNAGGIDLSDWEPIDEDWGVEEYPE